MHAMKKSLILVFSLFGLLSYSQQEWELIHGSNSSFNVSNVFMTDTSHTWGTISGLIYFSADGGYTWDLQYQHDDYQYSDIFFLNSHTGWVVGWSEVLKTVDGGKNWTLQTLPNPLGLDVEAVYFLNADTGWIAGSYETIYVTYDGGNIWTSQNNYDIEHDYWLYDIQFNDPMHGCAVGGQLLYPSKPFIMTTEDGGENWVEILPSNNNELVRVQYINEFQIWACSNDGFLLTSYDRGFTWEAGADLFNINTRDMYFFDENRAIINGGHNMALTDDMWNTYQTEEYQFANTTLNFSFPDDKNGMAVGHNNQLITSDGGYTWKRVNDRFNNIAFFTTMNGWILPEYLNKNMLHSTDGGSTWAEVILGQRGRLLQMSFPSDETGFVISEYAELLKTTNAGETWDIINLPFDTVFMNDFEFLDENIGFMCDYPNTLYKSMDGGYTWQTFPVDTLSSLVAMDFISPREGWVVGWDGICGHTLDGGLTWSFETLETGGLRDVKFIDHQTGFITSQFKIFRTSDGGNTWQQLPYFLSQPANIEFSDALNGWINDRANVYRTYDGGLTWVDSLNFDSENYQDQITDLFLIDSTYVWMCTMDGRVYLYSGLQGTDEIKEPELISFYPNPVSDRLTIEISDKIKDNLTIRIFTIDGKLMLCRQYSGLNQDRLMFDLSGFSTGLYLLNCQGSSVSKSYKLVKE
jgi:photosystem II stability/assembly factor-like uncharacterized protein